MTVIRDCTGTYLRWDGKDYQVCNLEKVSSFPDSAAVTVIFKKMNKCGSAKDIDFSCSMMHPNAGWIEVHTIK